jgi:hypothetical protein
MRRIEAEMGLLEQEYRSNGLDRLLAVIRQRTRTEPNFDFDYVLADPAGKRLAGNLPIITDQLGWSEIWACPGFVERSGLGIRVSGLTAFCPPLWGNLLVRPRASFRPGLHDAEAVVSSGCQGRPARWRCNLL